VLFTTALLAACARNEPVKKHSETAAHESSAKITQFYASPPAVPKGDKALLCYGVEGAAAVRVEPPVEKLNPSLSRCIEVTPQATTTYTLTAEDRNGATVSQTTTINVGGAAPRMYDISINAKTVKRGQQVSFCFQAANAVSVRGGPGKFFRNGNPQKDCLMDSPSRTTTYTVTVANNDGLTDSASITVEVK
jgi:hypothetical protein